MGSSRDLRFLSVWHIPSSTDSLRVFLKCHQYSIYLPNGIFLISISNSFIAPFIISTLHMRLIKSWTAFSSSESGIFTEAAFLTTFGFFNLSSISLQLPFPPPLLFPNRNQFQPVGIFLQLSAPISYVVVSILGNCLYSSNDCLSSRKI